MRIFKSYPDQIKIILSTNIAETSVTIPGIRFVIDSGLVKIRTYKNSTGIDALKVEAISKNSSTQRAGRAGRETSGKCFRLYAEDTYENLEENTVPEILRCNLSGVILSLKAIGIKDVSKIDFIDKPIQQAYVSAFQILIKLGALSAQTAELTQTGKEMAILPTEPLYSKLLITSLKDEYADVQTSISAIVALLSVENILYNPKGMEKEVIKKRKKFVNYESDHLTLLSIFNFFTDVLKSKSKKEAVAFAREHFLNDKSLLKAFQIQEQLNDYVIQIMNQRKAEPKKATVSEGIDKEKQYMIIKCLHEGLPLNIAQRDKGNTYKTIQKEECNIHPSSFLLQNTKDSEVSRQTVIYSEIILTTKNYLRCVTDISFLNIN